MKILLPCLFVPISWVIYAQQKLFEGVIVDSREQVIPCKIAVEVAFDALIYQAKTDSSVSMVLPAHRVRSFRYFDSRSNINRQFISLHNQSIFRFFEVVIFGEAQILRRVKRGIDPNNADEGYDYDFYCLFRNELSELKRFEQVVLPLFSLNHEQELHDFIKQEKLHMKDVRSIFSVVKKFNQLNKQQNLVATR